MECGHKGSSEERHPATEAYRSSTHGNKFPEAEGPYETGMDESFKAAASALGIEESEIKTRRNSRSGDYYELQRSRLLLQQQKMDSLDLAEREMALTERRNREAERANLIARQQFQADQGQLKHLDHYGILFDRQVNLEAVEARSNSAVLDGFDIQALRGAIIAAVSEALSKFTPGKQQ